MLSDIPEVERTEINTEIINAFQREGEFVGLSVSLLVEAGSYLCIVGNIYFDERKGWGRNQAIIGGHIVRLYKIISAMLDQTCQMRREISFIMARLAFECIVNLQYLIKNSSNSDLFDSYVKYSLQHEKKLLTAIQENIKKRNDEKIPIEQRMIESIERSFKVSRLNPVENYSKIKNWGGLNLYEKAQTLGLDELYLAAFGGGSHTVHGNWQDLLEYHLISDGDDFKPNFEWHLPRPQILNVTALITIETILVYLNWLFESKLPKDFIEKLIDLQKRVNQLEELHDNFLIKIKG